MLGIMMLIVIWNEALTTFGDLDGHNWSWRWSPKWSSTWSWRWSLRWSWRCSPKLSRRWSPIWAERWLPTRSMIMQMIMKMFARVLIIIWHEAVTLAAPGCLHSSISPHRDPHAVQLNLYSVIYCTVFTAMPSWHCSATQHIYCNALQCTPITAMHSQHYSTCTCMQGSPWLYRV